MELLLHNEFTRSLTETLKVPYLYSHLSLVLFSCVGFFLVQNTSQLISPIVFPEQFKKFSSKTKLDWDLHFTGWIHALIATPLALRLILFPSPSLVEDPIFGYAPLEGAVYAFSFGYFLYDFIVSVYFIKSHGLPFVFHATACCFIFFKAFTPFLMGIGSMFLIWEFSTIFLHVHWYLDKIDMSGSKLQLVNGILLVLSFFGTRIVYGAYQSYMLWNILESDKIHLYMRWGFRASSIVLGALNWSWFRLMILSVLKRFDGKSVENVDEAEAINAGKVVHKKLD